MRTLILLVLATMLTAAPAADTFDARVVRMHNAWDRFVRELWGCAADARHRSECEATQSRIDRQAFTQACNSAKQLWGLKGDCQ